MEISRGYSDNFDNSVRPSNADCVTTTISEFSVQMREYYCADENEKALLLASWLLDQDPISVEQFSLGVDALFWATHRQDEWAARVDQAFQRLQPQDQTEVRQLMLYFYGAAGMSKQVMAFAPSQFDNLIELAYAMDATVNLGLMESAQNLVPLVQDGIHHAEDVEIKLWLAKLLQRYYTRADDEFEVGVQMAVH